MGLNLAYFSGSGGILVLTRFSKIYATIITAASAPLTWSRSKLSLLANSSEQPVVIQTPALHV